jgi:hypothetical protein
MNKLTTVHPAAPAKKASDFGRYLEADRIIRTYGEKLSLDTARSIRLHRGDSEQEILRQLEGRLPRSIVASIESSAHVALSGEFEEKPVLLGLAQLIDAYPSNRMPNMQVYIGSAMSDLREFKFSTATIIAALQTLRWESKFLPSIAEILEACRTQRGRYIIHRNAAQKTLKALDEAETLLEEARQARTALEAEATPAGPPAAEGCGGATARNFASGATSQ